MEQSAQYGTYLHHLFGRILLGAEYSFDENVLLTLTGGIVEDFDEMYRWYKEEKRDIRKDVYGFVKWVRDYNIRPLAIEYPLMNEYGVCAGCVDLVCLAKFELNEEDCIVMVDYKKSRLYFSCLLLAIIS